MPRFPAGTNYPRAKRRTPQASIAFSSPQSGDVLPSRLYAVCRLEEPGRLYRRSTPNGILALVWERRETAVAWTLRERFEGVPLIELGNVVEFTPETLSDCSSIDGFMLKCDAGLNVHGCPVFLFKPAPSER